MLPCPLPFQSPLVCTWGRCTDSKWTWRFVAYTYETNLRHPNPLSYLVVYTTMERLLDSLASLTNEMTVPALEDAKWWNHLLQANLAKVVKILEERRNVLCVLYYCRYMQTSKNTKIKKCTHTKTKTLHKLTCTKKNYPIRQLFRRYIYFGSRKGSKENCEFVLCSFDLIL